MEPFSASNRQFPSARVFGSAARGDDTEESDLDILVESSPGTTLYDLARVELELETLLGCKVEVLTRGFLAPDVTESVEADLTPIP
jgi:predicted nucleotidyltransferase